MLRLYFSPANTSTTEQAQVIFTDYQNNKQVVLTLLQVETYHTINKTDYKGNPVEIPLRQAVWRNESTGTTYKVKRQDEFTIYIGKGFYRSEIRIGQGWVGEDSVTMYFDAPNFVNIRRAEIEEDPAIQAEFKEKAKRKVSVSLEQIKRKFKGKK